METIKSHLVFASHNPNKLAEIRRLLPGGTVMKSLAELGNHQEVEETASDWNGNAKIKCESAFRIFQLPTVSEDSGLEVEALNGAPGVYSARYAGLKATAQQNTEKLLKELHRVANRNARFVTVFCFTMDGENYFYFEGECRGHIAWSPSGVNGFGYDPVFIPEGSSRTFAEMNPEEKNQYSHRRKALAHLLEFLNKMQP